METYKNLFRIKFRVIFILLLSFTFFSIGFIVITQFLSNNIKNFDKSKIQSISPTIFIPTSIIYTPTLGENQNSVIYCMPGEGNSVLCPSGYFCNLQKVYPSGCKPGEPCNVLYPGICVKR